MKTEKIKNLLFFSNFTRESAWKEFGLFFALLMWAIQQSILSWPLWPQAAKKLVILVTPAKTAAPDPSQCPFVLHHSREHTKVQAVISKLSFPSAVHFHLSTGKKNTPPHLPQIFSFFSHNFTIFGHFQKNFHFVVILFILFNPWNSAEIPFSSTSRDGCPTSEGLLATFPLLNRPPRNCAVDCSRKIAVAPVGGLQGGNAHHNSAMAGN